MGRRASSRVPEPLARRGLLRAYQGARFPAVIGMGLVLLSAPAAANDSWFPGVGGNLSPIAQHPSVELVAEGLRVELDEGHARVDARFTLVNRAPRKATVRTGFPECQFGAEIDRDEPPRKWHFKNVRSQVDGTSIPMKPGPPRWMEEQWCRFWTKEFSFPAKAQRVVEFHYESPLGTRSDGAVIFRYVLTTGGTWRGGTIGELTIDVDLGPDFPRAEKLVAEPPGAMRRGRALSWKLGAFKPSKDLVIETKGTYNVDAGRDIIPWELGGGGLGGIDASVSLTKPSSVEGRLPEGAQLRATSRLDERSCSYVDVFRGKDRVAVISVDKAGHPVRIQALRPDIEGPAGLRVGSTGEALVATGYRASCRLLPDEKPPRVGCTLERLANVVLVLESPPPLPASQVIDPKRLVGAIVRRIDWTPPPASGVRP
jgi:hypothetical protein